MKFITFAWFQFQPTIDARIDASRPSASESKFKAVVERCQARHGKEMKPSPSRYRCRWNRWLPFSIVGSSGWPYAECEKPLQRSANHHSRLVSVVLCTIATNMACTDIKLGRCSRTPVDFVSSGQNVTKVVGSITSFVAFRALGIQGESILLVSWRWIDAPFRFTNGSSGSDRQVERRRIGDPFKYVHRNPGRGAEKRVEGNSFTIPVNKSFNTMTWCGNSIYIQNAMMLSQ